jgi:hypothetical protein
LASAGVLLSTKLNAQARSHILFPAEFKPRESHNLLSDLPSETLLQAKLYGVRDKRLQPYLSWFLLLTLSGSPIAGQLPFQRLFGISWVPSRKTGSQKQKPCKRCADSDGAR